MCDNNKFYICEHCGNLIGMIHDAGVPMMCCGQKMTKLEPGVVEASHEKHIPVVSVDGNIVTVTIGSVEHPMLEEHHIEWVYLQTDKGGQRKCLEVGKPPVVTFALYPHVFVEWIEENQGLLKSGALITDVTGVKRSIVYKFQDILRPDVERAICSQQGRIA